MFEPQVTVCTIEVKWVELINKVESRTRMLHDSDDLLFTHICCKPINHRGRPYLITPRDRCSCVGRGRCHVRCVAGVLDTPLPPNTAQSAALLPVYWTSLPCFQYDTPICLRQRFSQPRLQRILKTEKLESSDLRVILNFVILHFLLLFKKNLKDTFQ